MADVMGPMDQDIPSCFMVDGPLAESRQCYRDRVKAKMSLRDAAKTLGLTPQTLANFEWGRAEIPADMAREMDTLYKFTHAVRPR